MMLTRLFVGNVSYSLDDEGLASELAALGLEVKNVRIIKDRDTGNPRGFGFFEVDPGQAENAIQIADGAPIAGRPVRVAVASQQPSERTARPRNGSSEGGNGRPDRQFRRPDRPRRSQGRKRDDDDGRDDFGDRRRRRAW